MANIQIWGGGPYHPTRAQAELLKEWFAGLGHRCAYSESRSAFDSGNLRSTDLLLLSGMDESTVTPQAELQYWETPANRREAYEPLSTEHGDALKAYLAAGKPLFIHHSGILSFDERKELDEVYDGRWIRGQTFHPPYQKFPVRVNAGHPIVEGVGDFEIEDEMYCKLLKPRRSRVLLEATWEGEVQPLSWVTTYNKSKIFFFGLGHDVNSYRCPELRRIIVNGVNWLLPA